MTASKSTARLEARIPQDVHALLKRAAEIEGRTLTDFVVSAARTAAFETVERSEVFRLSSEASAMIAGLLVNPPPANDAMKRALEQHKKLFGDL
jgi:uncharacterized protein (DUF1778 family)